MIQHPANSVADAVGASQVVDLLRSDFPGHAVGRVVEALSTPTTAFESGLGNLRKAVLAYYGQWRTLSGPAKRRLTQEGQIYWPDTTLAAFQRSQAQGLIARCPPSLRLGDVRQIVDLGAGDGRMTKAVLDALTTIGAQIHSIDLLDQNGPALRRARERLEQHAPDVVINVCERDFRRLRPAPSAGRLALASAALHELSQPERISFLQRLANQVDCLVVVELSQDHTSWERLSAAQALKAAQFYDKLIADALRSLPQGGLPSCVGVFLLGELLQIWAEDDEGRGNYHLAADSWIETLAASGFDIAASQIAELEGLETVSLAARPLRR